MREDDPLVLIAVVYSQDELALLTSRLRWEDIWCFPHSAGLIAIDVGWTWALGGIRLFVHREDAKAVAPFGRDAGMGARWRGLRPLARS